MNKFTIFSLIFLAGCSSNPEIYEKHEWSVLQSSSWNLRDKLNSSGAFVVKDPKWGDVVLAIPLKDAGKGYGVILLSSKNPDVIKSIPKNGFSIRRSDVEKSIFLAHGNKKIIEFIKSSAH